MLTHESRVESARNDTLLHRASGQALNRLSDLYGFERPEIVKEEYWQEALRTSVFGARGTLGTLLSFLENMFGEFIAHTTYDMEVVDLNTLRYTGGEAICNLEARYIKIDGKHHFTSHSDGNLLHLSPTDASYWRAPDLSDKVGEVVSVAVYPYLIEEHDGTVYLIIDAGLFTIPPTYLRTDGEARQNEPNGGHIMNFFSANTDEAIGDQVRGAYPVYLIVEEFFGSFFPVILNVLAAGIPLKVESRVWCEGQSSIYGSLTNFIQYGSVDPDVISAVPART